MAATELQRHTRPPLNPGNVCAVARDRRSRAAGGGASVEMQSRAGERLLAGVRIHALDRADALRWLVEIRVVFVPKYSACFEHSWLAWAGKRRSGSNNARSSDITRLWNSELSP